MRSKDGRTYRVRLRPYRTVANVIDGVVLVFDDISELKDNERMLREMLEVVSDDVFIVDRHGIVRYANESARRLTSGDGFGPARPIRITGLPAP